MVSYEQAGENNYAAEKGCKASLINIKANSNNQHSTCFIPLFLLKIMHSSVCPRRVQCAR